MATLIQPRRWSTQKPPLAANIDRSHPLAQGLVGAWLFNEQGGSRVQNLAGLLQGSLVATYSWHPEGVEMSNDSSTTGRTNLGDIRITGDMTVLCSYTPLRLSGSLDAGVITKWNTGASPATNEWDLGGNGFASGGDARQFFGVAVGSTTAFAASAAGDVAVVGRRDALAGTRRGTALTVYRNAKSIGSATGPSGSLNTGTGRVVKLGEIDNGAGNNTNARFHYAYLWNRALGQAELQWLYVEPFAFVTSQAPRRRVWIPSGSTVSASGTATLDLTASTTAQAPVTSGASLSLTASANASGAPTATAALDLTAAATGSATPTGSAALTLTASSTATATPTATASLSLNASATASTTATASLTLTATGAGTPSGTSTASITLLATGTGAAPVGSTATLTLIAAGGVSAAITSAAMLTLSAVGVAVSFIATPTPTERIYRWPNENRTDRWNPEDRTDRWPTEGRVLEFVR